MHFVSIDIPAPAIDAIIPNLPRKADTNSAEIRKTFLSEYFGEGSIRPYAEIETSNVMRIVGWTEDPEGVAAKSAKLGLGFLHREWQLPPQGDAFDCAFFFSPIRRRPAEGRPNLILDIDPGEGKSSREQREIYVDWLRQRIDAPRTGLASIDIDIRQNVREPIFFKRREANFTHLKRQSVRRVVAEAWVKVVNLAQAQTFFSENNRSVGRYRAWGYGLVVPADLLAEAESHVYAVAGGKT
jgi:hypothetical protein